MADQVTDDQISAEMLRMDPTARAEVLLKSEQWLATEDTATGLRKRAQLMTLHPQPSKPRLCHAQKRPLMSGLADDNQICNRAGDREERGGIAAYSPPP